MLHASPVRPHLAVGCLLLGLAVPQAASAQSTLEPFTADVPGLRVVDARLARALDRVVRGSPTARAVLSDLSVSGLAVTIGTPEQLAELPDAQGGPAPSERSAMLAERGPGGDPAIAWVVFRVAPSADARGGEVERAWVVVDVDLMAGWIRSARRRHADARIEQDLLAILAHEFVAHVGSVARTRRLADVCDDPMAGADFAGQACSIRVENQVRRELNDGLALRGADRLPQRRSYSLDVMHFGQARLARTARD